MSHTETEMGCKQDVLVNGWHCVGYSTLWNIFKHYVITVCILC